MFIANLAIAFLSLLTAQAYQRSQALHHFAALGATQNTERTPALRTLSQNVRAVSSGAVRKNSVVSRWSYAGNQLNAMGKTATWPIPSSTGIFSHMTASTYSVKHSLKAQPRFTVSVGYIGQKLSWWIRRSSEVRKLGSVDGDQTGHLFSTLSGTSFSWFLIISYYTSQISNLAFFAIPLGYVWKQIWLSWTGKHWALFSIIWLNLCKKSTIKLEVTFSLHDSSEDATFRLKMRTENIIVTN